MKFFERLKTSPEVIFVLHGSYVFTITLSENKMADHVVLII